MSAHHGLFFFFFTILCTGRTLTLLTTQITIPTFKLILQLLVTPLILTKSIYMHYLQYIYYNTFLQYTMILKTNYIAELTQLKEKNMNTIYIRTITKLTENKEQRKPVINAC